MRWLSRIVAPIAAVAVVLTSAVAVPTPASAVPSPIVRNPGDPAYRVDLRTGSRGHVWAGTQSISFTNLDASPLSTIYLRLWSNGVLGCDRPKPSIRVRGMQGATFAEGIDCTELEVTLDDALATGQRATISFRLRIEVPPRNDRFGHHRGLALMGTALPILEVHDDLGWHHDPFIDLGESFYSIIGRYRVTLDTPRTLDTRATGVAANTTRPTRGRLRTTYVARDVRDFAWAAGRLDHLTIRVAGTRIVVSYPHGVLDRRAARRVLRVARRSMTTFSRTFGPYPYPELDVVVSRFATFGGMEYPTIVFTNRDRLTVSHELAHQWWYGLVGNDQFASPWLDESFATWSELLPFSPWTRCPRYPFPGDAQLTDDMAYWASHPFAYLTIYEGGACMLADLTSRFGLRRFTSILRRYATRHRLGVVRTEDFQAIVEKAAARHLPALDMDAYWDTWRVRPTPRLPPG